MASIQMQRCVGSKYSGHANMYHAKICTTLHIRFFSSVLWPIFANVIKIYLWLRLGIFWLESL